MDRAHNISHQLMPPLLQKNVPDGQTMKLLILIIQSFEMKSGYGIPLGNLTSQLFSNVYFENVKQSYLGVLKHCCGKKLEKEIRSI